MTKVDDLLSDTSQELQKKKKKKKKKDKKEDDEMIVEEKAKKKKKDKKIDDLAEDDDGMIVKEKAKSKKKNKKKTEDGDPTADFNSYTSPTPRSKKNVGLEDIVSPIKFSPKVFASPGTSKQKLTISSKDYDKWGVDYFHAILEEIRAKCERKLKIKDRAREAFVSECHDFYDTWMEKQESDQWLSELLEGNNSRNKSKGKGNQNTEQLIQTQTEFGKELDIVLKQRKKACIKAALHVFMGLKEDSLTRIQELLVKGAIIAQAGPDRLAEFASKGKENKKLLKRLFGDTQLMKEMLLHGGAAKYEYGEAIRIFVECMEVSKKKSGKKKRDVEDGEDFEDDEWSKIHRKIALACSLELASPMYEFDTSIKIDPVARYQHFVEAHKAGELDPAFPFFSIWEMRQIVNCDAPNDQMKWCRQMVMNYVPHLTCLTDLNLRYVYLLHSDVRIRKPEWTGSPRTYPMVLSGGGNESVNSWFGRFMLKSFGLPSWGSKFRRKEGYTRWTPDGWVALNGADWDNCVWNGKTGKDFKTEVEARNKAPFEEYFKRLVTLQCLADIVDGDPNQIAEEEKDVLHPERIWRSMAIVSMELLFQTEPEVLRTFKREGKGLVETNCEKYLDKYQRDKDEPDIKYNSKLDQLVVPASKHGFKGGNTVVIESFEGGKQLNFVADGAVEYEIPDDLPSGSYTLTFEVCTVSSKQHPLMLKPDDDSDYIDLLVPYTKGEWATTEGVIVQLQPGSTMRFSRPKGSLGLAIKKFTFTGTLDTFAALAVSNC